MRRLSTPSSPLALYEAQPGQDADRHNQEQVQPGKHHLAKAQAQVQTLVLGHALGANRFMWDDVLHHLPKDVRVIVWEQPGHGNSGLLDVSAPSVLDIADALAVALDDLEIEKCALAGLSLGGMVALGFAHKYPSRLHAVGIFDAGPVLKPTEQWFDRAMQVEDGGLAPLADGTMERWFTTGFRAGAGKHAVESTKRTFLATSKEGYAQCCRIIARTDLTDSLGAIEVPALVLTGDEDAGMTPRQAEDLAGALGNAAEPVIISGARHLTAVEHPRRVAMALEGILEGPLAGN